MTDLLSCPPRNIIFFMASNPIPAQAAGVPPPRYLEGVRDVLTAPPRSHIYHRCIIVINECIQRLVRLQALPPGAKVLDYGCSVMQYRRHFPEHCDYIGADLPGNPGARVTVQPDGRLPVDVGSIDLVFSTQVLEHVQDPALYLAEALRALKPGGKLILTTHGTFVYHPDPEDNWRWTSSGLKRQVEMAGFKVTHIEGLVGGAPAALQFFQDSFWQRIPRRPRLLRKSFFWIMQTLITWMDRRYSAAGRLQDAWVFAVVAEKPVP